MRAFVGSDNSGELTTRRLRTGFIIFINSAPIYWLSKRQTSAETSSSGSKFIAVKQCCEQVRGLCYKLRMMGITIYFQIYILGYNKYVLYNKSKRNSSLENKSSSVAFHFFREGTAKCWHAHKLISSRREKVKKFGYVLHYINWYTWWQWITFNCQTTVSSQWLDCWKFSWWQWIMF